MAKGTGIDPYGTTAGTRYKVQYRKPGGARTTKRGFKTQREAKDFLASVTTAKATGEFIDPTRARATVGSLGPTWLALKRSAKPSYYATLERDWRVYVEPMWGHRQVGSITATQVETWVQDLLDGSAPTARSEKSHNKDGPRSASVVLRCLGILRGILDIAVKDMRIRKNPAAGVENQPRKHSEKDRRYLDDAELARFASNVGSFQLAVLVLVLGYTGLRWGEAIALRVRDVNMLRRRLHVARNAVEVKGEVVVGAPKSWEKRTVPFPQFLDRALAQLIEGKGRDSLVFSDALGGHLRRPKTDEESGSWFRAAQHGAELERFTIHDLRHTAASLAIRSGAHVKAVQRMLGHKSAAMTLDTYADLFDSDLDDVSERMNERGATHGAIALAAYAMSA